MCKIEELFSQLPTDCQERILEIKNIRSSIVGATKYSIEDCEFYINQDLTELLEIYNTRKITPSVVQYLMKYREVYIGKKMAVRTFLQNKGNKSSHILISTFNSTGQS